MAISGRTRASNEISGAKSGLSDPNVVVTSLETTRFPLVIASTPGTTDALPSACGTKLKDGTRREPTP